MDIRYQDYVMFQTLFNVNAMFVCEICWLCWLECCCESFWNNAGFFFCTKLGITDAGAALQYRDCFKRLRHKPVA